MSVIRTVEYNKLSLCSQTPGTLNARLHDSVYFSHLWNRKKSNIFPDCRNFNYYYRIQIFFANFPGSDNFSFLSTWNGNGALFANLLMQYPNFAHKFGWKHGRTNLDSRGTWAKLSECVFAHPQVSFPWPLSMCESLYISVWAWTTHTFLIFLLSVTFSLRCPWNRYVAQITFSDFHTLYRRHRC